MARTLNEAFSNATGEILIKTDCNPFVRSRGAIGEQITNSGDKRVGGATGVCIAQKGIEKVLRKFLTTIQILETNIDSTIIGNSSCLCAFKMSLVEPVDVINSMAEDTEELVLIRRQGHKVVVDPSVIAEEEIPNDFGKRRLQKDRRAQGVIRELKVNS